MDIHPLLLQSVGSLIAIFALYVLARALRLGRRPKLVDEESVRFAVRGVEDGFVPVRIAIGRGGSAALASDADGKIILVKRHGNRFAGRILTHNACAQEEVDAIIVDCGETRFGKVRLSIDQPNAWVDAINRL